MTNFKLTMNGKITALTFFIIVFSFLLAGLFIMSHVLQSEEKRISEQAMLVAQTVAKLSEVAETLSDTTTSNEQKANMLDETIQNVQTTNKADYIVVLTMDRVRLTHPHHALIGVRSQSNDLNDAFTEHYYTTVAKGDVGNMARAFVPVMNASHTQIGVVLVGYELPTFWYIVTSLKKEIAIAILLSLLFGGWGAFLLSRSMKRELLDYEPHEIAKLYIERTEAFNAMHEGVIAIDNHFTITVFNVKAKQILGVEDELLIGRNIYDVLPDSRLPEIIDFNQPIYNKELLINQHTILSNRVPIEVAGETVGAIAIFQDRTEVKKLAEELTGVKEFVQALRIQNHEHKNKIHTVAGLIQLGNYDEALHYIQGVKQAQDDIHHFLHTRIQNKNLAGLLLSKVNHGKELGITVEIDDQSKLDYLPPSLDFHDFVVVLGNLIENSFDALQLCDHEEKHLLISIDQDEQLLTILVEDNGIGMTEAQLARIFDNGFTTKKSKNHGIGLYLIHDIIQKANGTIDVMSTPNAGTSIVITFDMEG
ncbi:ATP-binding protein [Kurthia massiliensis]|uniref:ATP-binding protein n=1 Tax=Kurthia massiliensis TaxID=1033739 RepID=UPI0002885389|nr:sensor histidine kinase [Kurthia massiliensis]